MNGIKKMIKVICMVCILTLSAASEKVYASDQWEIEKLVDSAADYQEIMHLENEIRNTLKNFYLQSKKAVLPENFELDLGQAKKVYVDAPIFSLKSSDTESVMQNLENSDYMWLLPVRIGKDVFQIHIARNLPVREEIRDELSSDEIRRIEEEAGKWSLSGIELLEDTEIDFDRQVLQAMEQISYDYHNVKVVLCGGLNHIDNPAALVLNSQEVELLIPMYDLNIVGTQQQIDDLKPESAETDSEVYLYEKIKEAANSMESMVEYSGGSAYLELKDQAGTSAVQWYLPVGSIAVIVLAGVLYLSRRSHVR